jgi:hypothetical protein
MIRRFPTQQELQLCKWGERPHFDQSWNLQSPVKKRFPGSLVATFFSPAVADKLDPHALRPLSIWYHLIILAANPWNPCWTWIWQSGDLDSHSDDICIYIYIYIYRYIYIWRMGITGAKFCTPQYVLFAIFSGPKATKTRQSIEVFNVFFSLLIFLSKTHKIEGSV